MVRQQKGYEIESGNIFYLASISCWLEPLPFNINDTICYISICEIRRQNFRIFTPKTYTGLPQACLKWVIK